jgi:hypothetical protein
MLKNNRQKISISDLSVVTQALEIISQELSSLNPDFSRTIRANNLKNLIVYLKNQIKPN